MSLPPAVQEFAIRATEFLQGVDRMIAQTDQLAGSIDGATAATGAAQAGIDAQAAAYARAARSAGLLIDAQGRLREANGRFASSAQIAAVEADAEAAGWDRSAAAADRAGASAEAAGAKTKTAGAEAAGFGSMMKTAFLGVGIAAIYGIDQASKFQASMEMLHTQAGVAQSKIAGLSQQVLQLSGQVGEGPSSLAESLYHVASNMASMGATGPQMMSAVKTAAEGAQVGGANLVDVTNALTAAISSGIPGVQNFQQAMGMLNATVGSGDMHMQDLADAFSTGLLATVKGYGLSLKDVGAALATFGDNNIRGAKAGTDLRMAVQALAVPVATGKSLLQSWGMSTNQLARDMSSGGLMKALKDLQAHFKANGVTAKNEGEVITQLFGKKAGSGIAVLLEQMDRLKSKYPDIQKSADNFAGDWAARQKTFAQQWDNLKAGAQGLATSFGTILLPAATKVVGMLARFGTLLEKHGEIAAFAGALLALAAGFKIAASAAKLFGEESMLTNPIFLIIAGVIALAAALYELYTHSKLVRDIVADVGRFFKTVWTDAMHVAGAVVHWFVTGPLAFIKGEIKVFSDWWKTNGAEVKEVASAVWHFVSTVVVTEWKLLWDGFLKPGLVLLEAEWKIIWGVVRDTVKLVWDTIAAIVRTAIRLTLDVISVALDIFTGHWSKAWSDVKKLVSDAFHGIENILGTFIGGALHLLVDAGKNIIQGLINGMKSMAGGAVSFVKNLGSGLLHGAMSILGIGSPSREFYKLGAWITEGLANGIAGTTAQATAKASQLAADVWAAYDSGQITQSEADSLLSRISSKIATDQGTLVKTMQKIGLEMGAGLLTSMEDATSASAAKTAVNKLVSYVEQAWSAGDISSGRASSMTAWLERDNTRLQSLAAQRQTIAATIKTADTYAATTTSNTESWAGLSNVTSGMTGAGNTVYSGNILAGMQANLTSIKAFNTALTRLGKLGLRKDLLDQIIQMGPDQGLQVAQALLDGPMSVISQMNTTQAQIVTGSTQLGQAAADAMYDSGAQAGKGFLSGLEAQQASITKMMDQIAQSMITTVKRSLKISSPSQVFAEHGRMVALGLKLGIEDGVPGVKGAVRTLAGATAFHPGSSAGSAPAADAGGTVINVNVTFNGFVGNKEEVAREIYQVVQTQSLRHAKRNGLNNGFNL